MTSCKQQIRAAIFLIVLFFCFASSVQAAVPGLISYQGMLIDELGTPADGTYDMRFYLYDAPTGGAVLWDEQQSVAVISGFYSVHLGSVNALDSSDFSGIEVYLETRIYNAGSEIWETLSPRQRITSTAYAFQSENSNTLDGQESSAFAPTEHQHAGDDITSGVVGEVYIDPDIARVAEITWENLSGIPADIADGDQVGITTENDPTITEPSIKDGVSWDELSDVPAGFADNLDNTGIAIEIDPQVGTIATDYVPKWDGTSLVSGAIVDNGNIGIGRTNPYHKLDVAGIVQGQDTVNGNYGTLGDNVAGVIGVHGATGNWGHLGSEHAAVAGSYLDSNNATITTGAIGTASAGAYASHKNQNSGHLGGYNYGVYGETIDLTKDYYAGLFAGDIRVTRHAKIDGLLTKGGGSFKIDHPLDSENKYLQHSFVESPDMMNVYNGNAILDAQGEAWVDLPKYFESLNKDFRYQLTCIGGFAQVYIAEKVSNNRFKIAGGLPGMEVSWQVTGIRQDAWANANRILVETEKIGQERGMYLHPELFGFDQTRSVEYAHHPELVATRLEKVKILQE